MTSRLEFSVFGGLSLTRNGSAPGPAAGQRRPLAVLAMMAAAGDAGISRDKITTVLWPDADPERGRRALAQALYSLKRDAGAELFQGVADLRFNRDAVRVDVTEFEEAIRQNRLADAMDLYKGPFCDGFSVSGAPEFERWLDVERSRLETKCRAALRQLVEEARETGQADAEIQWSHRLFILDPLDSVATGSFMDALTASGDVARALRTARMHESLLRSELELPPSPTIADRVRDIAKAGARSESAVPPPTSNSRPMESLSQMEGDVPPRIPSGRLPRVRSHFGQAGRWASASALVLAVVIAVFFLTRRQVVVESAQAAPPMQPDVVVVLPFTVSTSDNSLRFLGEGSADLIARMLSDGGVPRAVDPGTVLALLDSIPMPSRDSGSTAWLTHARTVARKLGAGQTIVGKISGTTSSLSISATLVDAQSGKTQAHAEVTGPAADLSSLVEGLGTRLVAEAAIGPDRANAFADARFSVLRSYLQAESAFHSDNYRDAVVLYEKTLSQDSSFAPAALGLALAADRLNSAEQHDRGLALAWASKNRLGARDRSYLTALAGPRYPAPSTVDEQLAAWEDVVSLNPDRAAAWIELGERLMYDGTLLGIRNAGERAARAFGRAIELDPGDPSPRRNLIQLALRANDLHSIDEILRGRELRDIGGELTGYLSWRIAVARHDTAALTRVRQRFPSLSKPSLRAIAMASQHDAIERADGERALRLLSARAILGADQLDVLLAEHSLALNSGDPVRALDVTERLQDAQPGLRAHLRLRALDFLYGGGDSAAAAKAVEELTRVIEQRPSDPFERALRMADVCVVAQWHSVPWRKSASISSNEAAKIRRMIAELQSAPLPWRTIPVAASPRACAAIVEAMLAVSRGSRASAGRVKELDNMMLAGPALGDATTWATLATARLYETLGDSARALAVVRQRPYMNGWPRYLSTSVSEEKAILHRNR